MLGSRTSPYLQAKLALLGCENVFADVPCLVESLLGIKVNQSQVYRICQKAASMADKTLLDRPSTTLAKVASDKEQTVYGMVDGSMLLTHEGWQEVKVGRVFKATAVQENKAAKWQMNISEYVAQRGHYSEFTAKFETLLAPDSACKKVLISDGAPTCYE